MKKTLLFSALVFMFGVGLSLASEPVWMTRAQDGDYSVTQTTISISSSSVSTISASRTGYRKIWIQLDFSHAQLAAGTSVFFRIDGSTSNIPTVGYQVLGTTDTVTNAGQRRIVDLPPFETNNAIYGQMAPGISGSVLGRYLQKEK